MQTKEEIIDDIETWEEHILELEEEIRETRSKINCLKAFL